MIVGGSLGHANSSCGRTQRQRLVPLGFKNVTSILNECVPERPMMIVGGVLGRCSVPFLNACVFCVHRHACKHNCCAAERPARLDTVNIYARVVLTALTSVKKQVLYGDSGC